MSAEVRPLLMRANRLLGAALVEHNLVTLEDLERANERLLEIVASGELRQSTLLGILTYELKVVAEDTILQHLLDNENLGLIDLRQLDIPEDVKARVDVPAGWATWSVPFDREGDTWLAATAYYLSPAARLHWEKTLGGAVVWFATSLEMIADFLDRIEAERAAAAHPTVGGAAKTAVAPAPAGAAKP